MEKQTMYIRNKWLIGLLIFLLLFMPYSTFVLQALRYFLETHGVSLGKFLTLVSVGWKELILAILGISALGYAIKWKKLPFTLYPTDWLMLVFAAYGVLVGGLIVQSPKSVIFGFRYDFAVFLFYFIARFFRFDRNGLEKLFKVITYVSIPMLAFALLQVTVLPYQFLERFGYSWGMRISGNPLPPYHFVSDHILRAMSTFPGPNSLAMYAAFLLLVLLFFGRYWMAKYWQLLFGLGITAILVVTYSRGHLGSFLAAMVLWWILTSTWVKGSVRRMQAVTIGVVICSLLAALLVSIADVSSFAGKGSLMSFVFHNDSSEIHRNLRVEAWEKIRSHPLGTGLGTSGLATTNTGGPVFNPESWYVQITNELGWPGLILALAVIGGMLAWMVKIYHTFPDPRDQKTVMYFIVSFAAICVSAQFLPCWFEVASISWWVLFGLFIGDYEQSFGLPVRDYATSKTRMQAEIE